MSAAVGVLRGTDSPFHREDRHFSLAAEPHQQRAGIENAGDVPVNAALTEPEISSRIDGTDEETSSVRQCGTAVPTESPSGSVSVDQALLEKVRAIKDRVTETAE